MNGCFLSLNAIEESFISTLAFLLSNIDSCLHLLEKLNWKVFIDIALIRSASFSHALRLIIAHLLV